MDEMQDCVDRNNTPPPLGSDLVKRFESVAIQSSEYAYNDNKKLAANAAVSAPPRLIMFNDTFTKNTLIIKLNDGSTNYSEDDIISDKVAENIKEGIADINAGRTYTSDQVRKMLGLR